MSPEEALARALALCEPMPTELVPLDAALGRALTCAVQTARTLPPCDASAMDGYAVRSTDASPAARLRSVATIYAGAAPQRHLGPGECARIMTGAPLPPGSDAVVMQEKVRVEPGTDFVELLEAVAAFENVRRLGEDTRMGEILLPEGAPLGVGEAALLWSQGIARVEVPRRPRVAIASTGDELCHIDDEPCGRIVDSNSPAIAALAQRAGALPSILGIARDEMDAVKRLFAAGLAYDVLITLAGISVGERDFARVALEELGVAWDFWRIAIKPGKPLAVGKVGRTLVFGLPGNPTSAMVTFELFVRPCLRRLLGHRAVQPERASARLATPYSKKPGLTHFVRATARFEQGELWAQPLANQSSTLASPVGATHLMVAPAEATELPKGSRVELLPVSWRA